MESLELPAEVLATCGLVSRRGVRKEVDVVLESTSLLDILAERPLGLLVSFSWRQRGVLPIDDVAESASLLIATLVSE